MSNRKHTLRDFFGGYFHQDWDIDGVESWVGVVDQFVQENSIARVREVREALREWVDSSNEEEISRQLMNELGCDYDWQPDGLGARDWVLGIINRLTS
jgi:CdiI immunity protein